MSDTDLPERLWRQYPQTTIAAAWFDPLLSTEIALTDDARRAFLVGAYASNPNLRGARVADVLDIAYDTDAFLEVSEPYWERAGAVLSAEIGPRVSGLACLVAMYLFPSAERESPAFDAYVERLARAVATREVGTVDRPVAS